MDGSSQITNLRECSVNDPWFSYYIDNNYKYFAFLNAFFIYSYLDETADMSTIPNYQNMVFKFNYTEGPPYYISGYNYIDCNFQLTYRIGMYNIRFTSILLHPNLTQPQPYGPNLTLTILNFTANGSDSYLAIDPIHF